MSMSAWTREWMASWFWICVDLGMRERGSNGGDLIGLSLGLVILQWNAYSTVVHGAELKYVLENLQLALDVVCIQDTFLMEESRGRG